MGYSIIRKPYFVKLDGEKSIAVALIADSNLYEYNNKRATYIAQLSFIPKPMTAKEMIEIVSKDAEEAKVRYNNPNSNDWGCLLGFSFKERGCIATDKQVVAFIKKGCREALSVEEYTGLTTVYVKWDGNEKVVKTTDELLATLNQHPEAYVRFSIEPNLKKRKKIRSKIAHEKYYVVTYKSDYYFITKGRYSIYLSTAKKFVSKQVAQNFAAKYNDTDVKPIKLVERDGTKFFVLD